MQTSEQLTRTLASSNRYHGHVSPLDLQAEISFVRGEYEYLISEQLISAAIADPMSVASDGTGLDLIVDGTGAARALVGDAIIACAGSVCPRKAVL